MFVYPAARFVSNGLYKQLMHLSTEVEEVIDAYHEPDGVLHIAEELCDVIHSAETALRILASRYGVDVSVVPAAVIEKNRVRGYYDPEVQP